MRPLRILQTESSMTVGGQELATLALTEGLRARGHDVALVVRPQSPLARMARERHVPHHRLVMGKPMYPWAIAKLASIVSTHHIDIVHTNGSRDSWISGLAARCMSPRPRLVLTRHKTTPISKHSINKILYHALADAIVTTGGEIARKALLDDHGFDETKVVAIPPGADLTQFSPTVDGSKFRASIGVRDDDVLVGTMCFLRSYKGLEYFVDAASVILKRRPHCRFVIVGEGPEQERLSRQIERLGLAHRVVMVGYYADGPGALAALDVFVVASLLCETLTQTIPEALAMAIPVVATNVGSIPDIVRHGDTGWLVPPGDAASLAERIVAMMDHREQARSMAHKGRELVVNEFSKHSAVVKNEALYHRLLASRMA